MADIFRIVKGFRIPVRIYPVLIMGLYMPEPYSGITNKIFHSNTVILHYTGKPACFMPYFR